MDHITFPYRSSTHLPFLHVVAESGSWEKYGLEVDYDRFISSSDAHAAINAGDVDFVDGNHVSTYGHRARNADDKWIYLGQTVNYVPGRQLCVRPDSGIESVADLREKVVAGRGHHPMLNDWLFLKQRGLDIDRDDVALVDDVEGGGKHDKLTGEGVPLWHWVRDRKVDAAFLVPPTTVMAKEAGLELIDLEPLPMIYYTTISTSLTFIDNHPDIVERFLKGLIEGIHYFKTQPEKAIRIIRERYTREGAVSQEAAALTHQQLAAALEPSLFPSVAAISNVYELGRRQDKEAKRINPMELWDLHFIRRLKDNGFVGQLYAKGG